MMRRSALPGMPEQAGGPARAFHDRRAVQTGPWIPVLDHGSCEVRADRSAVSGGQQEHGWMARRMTAWSSSRSSGLVGSSIQYGSHCTSPVGEDLRDNIYYTFSGFNWTPTFLDLLLQVGTDRIMFSTDYPYASITEAARTFLDQLPVSAADKERIAHGSAERLLEL
jgi:Amidohydrolase